MAQTSYFWDGLITGDATLAPYDDDEYSDVIRDIMTNDRTTQGVMRSDMAGFDGLLEVTNPSGETIRVATGIGLVDGKLYRNSANLDNTAGVSGRWYRVVMTKDFAAQTVRIELLGPDTAIPTLTQNDGVEWQVPLAYLYNNGGVISIVDERVFIPRIFTENIEDSAVTTAKLADGSITAAKLANGALDFQLIQTVDVSEDDTEILFPSIAASWTHLHIVASLYSKSASFLNLRFNADAGANYTYLRTSINEAGTSDGSLLTGQTLLSIAYINSPASNSLGYSSVIIYIPDYAGAQKKSAIGFSNTLYSSGSNTSLTFCHGGYWDNIAAITEVRMSIMTASAFYGGVASLYGLA